MNSKDLEKYKNRLLDRKKELTEDLSFSSEESRPVKFDMQAHSTHMTDIADETMLKQNHISMDQHLREQIKEIDICLNKMERNEYGICENCHNKISKPRLEASPFARFCIDCRQISEKI